MESLINRLGEAKESILAEDKYSEIFQSDKKT